MKDDMQHLRFVPRLNADDLQHVLDHCTPEDGAELDAAGLPHTAEALAIGLNQDGLLGAIWSPHGPVAAFGCVPHPENPLVGVPWMIATPQFRQYPREAMKHSREQITAMRQRFDALLNWVHCEHAVAIRWLGWLGFNVEHQPVGPNGAFLEFSWSKSNV